MKLNPFIKTSLVRGSLLLLALIQAISSFAGVSKFVAALPDPLDTKPIIIPAALNETGSPITYTDCVENTFLRFFQLALLDMGNPSRIDLGRLHELSPVPEFVDFFEKHPEILPNSFYSTTEPGQEIRNEWAYVVSKLDLDYNRHGRFELNPNIKNLLKITSLFFPAFRFDAHAFPTFASPEVAQEHLTSLARFISRPGFEFEFKLSEQSASDLSEFHGEPIIYRETVFGVSINGESTYKWDFYEYVRTMEDIHVLSGHGQLYEKRDFSVGAAGTGTLDR